MGAFLLVPDSGGDAWPWHRFVAELTARGRTAVAVGLLADDPAAGFARSADVTRRSGS